MTIGVKKLNFFDDKISILERRFQMYQKEQERRETLSKFMENVPVSNTSETSTNNETETNSEGNNNDDDDDGDGGSDDDDDFISPRVKLKPWGETATASKIVENPHKKSSILILSANPTNTSRLRIDEEVREIQEKIKLSKYRNKFSISCRTATRPDDFIQALLDIEPSIVHFSGHGIATGELIIENQIGNTHKIPPHGLVELFRYFSNNIVCIFLNACYSATVAKAISQYIPYVIGMSNTISDQAAIAFTKGFYQALGAGHTISEAFSMGCIQIRLHSLDEHQTPKLFTNKYETNKPRYS